MQIFPKRIKKFAQKLYPFLFSDESRYGAAVSHPNGKAYFFAGDKYYRFDYTADQVDKIGRIGIDGWKGVPNNIGAAVLHPNGKVCFFAGDKYYRFDFSSDKVDRIGKIGIDGWSGLPINIDCVVEHTNGKAYFFVGRKYYHFYYKTDKVDKIATVGIDGWKHYRALSISASVFFQILAIITRKAVPVPSRLYHHTLQ